MYLVDTESRETRPAHDTTTGSPAAASLQYQEGEGTVYPHLAPVNSTKIEGEANGVRRGHKVRCGGDPLSPPLKIMSSPAVLKLPEEEAGTELS
jgi:hypothetical protein